MNDELRKATDRIMNLERKVDRHDSVINKILRVILPLRRQRRRIEKPSIKLTDEEVVAMRAQMEAHGVPDTDDDETPDPKTKWADVV